jgi:hypothetical protein
MIFALKNSYVAPLCAHFLKQAHQKIARFSLETQNPNILLAKRPELTEA